MNFSQDRFIKIDQEGYFLFDSIRLTEAAVGFSLFEKLRLADLGAFVTTLEEQDLFVEAFDEPYVALQVHQKNGKWSIQCAYEFTVEFELSSLTLDEWDRFHGVALNGVPFVFSRAAQSEFFNLLDEFDDTSITWHGKQIEVPSWLPDIANVEDEKFWSDRYREQSTHWDLGQASPILQKMLPKLRLPKSRVLVLGAGTGHDAAFFAEQGHWVTAVDISEEALTKARALHAHLPNLQFVQSDLFSLPQEFTRSFDVVFEHTCYCAINPALRSQLVEVWKKCLTEKGHLFGIFFTMEKRMGPPFGGTEWELQQRLKKAFRFLYWNRWQESVGGRQGKELFVYAERTLTFK